LQNKLTSTLATFTPLSQRSVLSKSTAVSAALHQEAQYNNRLLYLEVTLCSWQYFNFPFFTLNNFYYTANIQYTGEIFQNIFVGLGLQTY
jgi:hypothetical protein